VRYFKKKMCPLCREPFLENADDLPVNWVLIELMELEIETPKTPVFKKIHLKYIQYRILKEIVGLIRRIRSVEPRGYIYYDYASHFPDLSAPEIEDARGYISQQLIALGYRVTHVERLRTCMCIFWMSRSLIIEWKTGENGSTRYIPISHRE
ncbi:MAG: hypothetical protein EBX52_14745, partial [Proteobacteria bacterium]|nr:hypothetical protein [Pseudomonadota bacterium]